MVDRSLSTPNNKDTSKIGTNKFNIMKLLIGFHIGFLLLCAILISLSLSMLSDSKTATGIIEFTYTPIEKSAIKIDSLGFNDSSNLFISANIDDVHVTDENGSKITSSSKMTYKLTCYDAEFVKLEFVFANDDIIPSQDLVTYNGVVWNLEKSITNPTYSAYLPVGYSIPLDVFFSTLYWIYGKGGVLTINIYESFQQNFFNFLVNQLNINYTISRTLDVNNDNNPNVPVNLVFHSNGGRFADGTCTWKYHSVTKIPITTTINGETVPNQIAGLTNPIRDGFTFVGWSDLNSEEIIDVDNNILKINNNFDYIQSSNSYFAIWRKNGESQVCDSDKPYSLFFSISTYRKDNTGGAIIIVNDMCYRVDMYNDEYSSFNIYESSTFEESNTSEDGEVTITTYRKKDYGKIIGLDASAKVYFFDLAWNGDITISEPISSEMTMVNNGESQTVKDNPIKTESADLKCDLKFYLGNTCVLEGTLVTLANGTTKPVEDVTYNDLLLIWNSELGCYDYAYANWIEKGTAYDYYQLTTFADGSTLKTYGGHSIFSVDDNCFISVCDKEKFKIGTTVFKHMTDNDGNVVYDNNGNIISTTTQVVSIEYIKEEFNYYFVMSNFYLNSFSNGFLTSEPVVHFSNFYEFNENMQWDVDIRNAVLNGEYGELITYEDFDDILTESMFNSFTLMKELNYFMFRYNLSLEDIKNCFKNTILISHIPNETMIVEENGNKVEVPICVVSTSDEFDKLFNENYEKTKIIIGDKYTLQMPKIIEQGKTFVGWKSSADGKIYQAGESVEIWSGTHFTAIWK